MGGVAPTFRNQGAVTSISASLVLYLVFFVRFFTCFFFCQEFLIGLSWTDYRLKQKYKKLEVPIVFYVFFLFLTSHCWLVNWILQSSGSSDKYLPQPTKPVTKSSKDKCDLMWKPWGNRYPVCRWYCYALLTDSIPFQSLDCNCQTLRFQV